MAKDLAHDQSFGFLRRRRRGSCRPAPHDHTHTHIEIFPRRESNLRLEITRSPQPGIDPGGTIELPMEDVHGRFIFDDGSVAMHDVNFNFRARR